jgi:hypothetical protein
LVIEKLLTPQPFNYQSQITNQKLLHFFMCLVLSATGAELFQFDAVRCRLAVLGG